MRSAVAIVLMMTVVLWITPLMAGDAAAGKDLFAKKCASCHGPNGEGKETVAKLFNVELKPLASKEVQAKTDADLKKVSIEGSGKMKPVKDLDSKSADDIVAFVRSLAKK